MPYYLGADIGSTKTHIAIADESGQVVGFGQSGSGNHQSVGFAGMLHTLQDGLAQALAACTLTVDDVVGGGLGIAGYDWPSHEPELAHVIDQLGLICPYEMVNDAIIALVAGAEAGWGVALVSGTGCNCRGRDQTGKYEGRVTGYGYHLGEFAGASELVWRAVQLAAYEWTKRGPATAISAALIQYAGVKDLSDMLEGYSRGRTRIGSQAAPLIFEVARQGDPVARDLIRWAGVELGEMGKAVIRQLGFEKLSFDVVLSGSMFDGGPLLIEPMWETISSYAPGARLVPLKTRPVVGAVILGMEQGGVTVTPKIRATLVDSLARWV